MQGGGMGLLILNKQVVMSKRWRKEEDLDES